MTTIDRYIIRQFLINFVILAVVLLSFFVLVDLVFALDEFVEAGRVWAERWAGGDDADEPGRWQRFLGTLWAIADFYGPMLLLIICWLAGLLVSTAMGFTLTNLSRSGELIAMVTSGLSMHRLAAPIVVTSALLIGLTLLDQELLIPKLASKLARKHSQVAEPMVDTWAVPYTPDSGLNLFRAATFDPDDGVLRDITVLVRGKNGRLSCRISAEHGQWDAQRGGWSLTTMKVRAMQQDHAQPRPTAGAVEQDCATLKDADARAECLCGRTRHTGFITTDLSPQVLRVRRAELFTEFLSLRELGELMNNPAAEADRVQKIMHKRFSLIVVNILIVVMGLPFFLTREPTNVFLQTVKAGGVCLVAWGGGFMLLHLNLPGVSPVVAAWLPVVFLLPISALLMMSVKT